MDYNIVGAVVCTFAGMLIAFANYVISRRILMSCPERFALSTVIRQIIQIGYLVAVYFIGSRLELKLMFLLIGAVAGMTVPMLFFTKKLVSVNQSLAVKPKNGEGDENG